MRVHSGMFSILSAVAVVAGVVGCDDSTSPPEADELDVVTAPAAAGVPGWALIDTIRVRVQAGDEPMAGVPVSWDVTGGGGSVAVLDDETDAAGIVAAVWTLGPAPGPNRLVAEAGPGLDATFDVMGAAFGTTRVAGSDQMGCGIVDGAIWCSGAVEWTGAPASTAGIFGLVDASPALVSDAREYEAVAVSGFGVCGLDGGGVPWCSASDAETLSPLASVPGAPALRYLVGAGWAAGTYCGLAASDSTAWCWTEGASGPLTGSPAFAEVVLEGGSGLAGPLMACGRLADSTAACWGDGPLGDGSTAPSPTAVAVAGGHHFAEVVVGLGFACGREADGEVWCWGDDFDLSTNAAAPVTTPALATTGASMIAASGPYVLALTDGGMVRWQGAGYEDSPQPQGLLGSAVVELSGPCARVTGGGTYCLAELWDTGTAFRWDQYIPLQPLQTD